MAIKYSDRTTFGGLPLLNFWLEAILHYSDLSHGIPPASRTIKVCPRHYHTVTRIPTQQKKNYCKLTISVLGHGSSSKINTFLIRVGVKKN